ncbi:MAG: hypothetical protein M1827_003431 [Pycnora praestabilis]|nr:MAG: hypothetical protein M1827_003431 [Pycnora praestabilis]
MASKHSATEGSSLGINVRTFNDVDLDMLKVSIYKGDELEPAYQAPKVATSKAVLKPGMQLYNGSCHCKAVSYTVEFKPFTDTENGELWIYPSKSSVELYGQDALSNYQFGKKRAKHSFCSICGVSAIVRINDPEVNVMPVNVRTMNGVDLEDLKIKKYDGWKELEPQYTV